MEPDDDEFVPFEHTVVSKYGPISRMAKAKMKLTGPVQVTAALQASIPKYRVSSLWKNHGNLENEKNFFQTWKNHGIWKKPQKPGKIMEFEKINLEKSWNFFSDFKHCEINFLHASRTFQVLCTCLSTFYCCTLIFPKFISIKHPVINQCMD